MGIPVQRVAAALDRAASVEADRELGAEVRHADAKVSRSWPRSGAEAAAVSSGEQRGLLRGGPASAHRGAIRDIDLVRLRRRREAEMPASWISRGVAQPAPRDILAHRHELGSSPPRRGGGLGPNRGAIDISAHLVLLGSPDPIGIWGNSAHMRYLNLRPPGAGKYLGPGIIISAWEATMSA